MLNSDMVPQKADITRKFLAKAQPITEIRWWFPFALWKFWQLWAKIIFIKYSQKESLFYVEIHRHQRDL